MAKDFLTELVGERTRRNPDFPDKVTDAERRRKLARKPVDRFTARQGQYLAFVHLYTKLHRRPPAEADMQDYFRTTPPAVHQMVVTLERRGLISRVPGQARSIRVLVAREELPELE
jgi:DNA-binding MarR family transcriptional regulator